MRNLRARVAMAIVLLAMTAAVSPRWLYQARMERGAARAGRLPLALGGWTGEELPIDAHIKQVLETDDLIMRNYAQPAEGGGIVQLAVVFSPTNRRVAHPPEVCYKGAGWEVVQKRTVAVQGLPPMARLVLSRGPLRDVVMYCYLSGDELTANYYAQQTHIVLNTIRQRSTSSALLRFSTPLREGESIEQAEARTAAFARLMMPEIEKTLGGKNDHQ